MQEFYHDYDYGKIPSWQDVEDGIHYFQVAADGTGWQIVMGVVRNGRHHCQDGPALEWSDGGKEYQRNGYLHRIDGPAVERPNGDDEWYWYGQLMTFDQWLKTNYKISDEDKTLLKLEYG